MIHIATITFLGLLTGHRVNAKGSGKKGAVSPSNTDVYCDCANDHFLIRVFGEP